MRKRLRLSALPALLGALAAGSSAEMLPSGPGILLPLQDRIGETRYAELVETELRKELASIVQLDDGAGLRGALRRLRIRDAANEAPERLAELARELQVEWYMTVTLLQALEGPVPIVTLSGKLFEAGSPRLTWAGFESATGVDGEGWLGLGATGSIDELIRQTAQALVADLSSGPRPVPRGRLGRARTGYLLEAIPADRESPVAVVPLESITDSPPWAAAELVTDALLASLHELGYSLLLPGRVGEILREEGRMHPGLISRPGWEALGSRGGAAWIATGMVETFEIGPGERPDPWVAFSLRLIDATTGRICWIDGRELTGRETTSIFERGRAYSAGDLTREMMRSMLAGLAGDVNR